MRGLLVPNSQTCDSGNVLEVKIDCTEEPVSLARCPWYKSLHLIDGSRSESNVDLLIHLRGEKQSCIALEDIYGTPLRPRLPPLRGPTLLLEEMSRKPLGLRIISRTLGRNQACDEELKELFYVLKGPDSPQRFVSTPFCAIRREGTQVLFPSTPLRCLPGLTLFQVREPRSDDRYHASLLCVPEISV